MSEMKNLFLIAVALTLSFSVQSVTLAQIFEDVLSEPESVQQVADIALLGDRNVVIELLDGENIVHKFSLAGPTYRLQAEQGLFSKSMT